MKFWKYGRVAAALIGSIVLGMSITCCGVYTSGYMYVTSLYTGNTGRINAYKIDHDFGYLTPVTGSPFAANGSNPVQEQIIPGGRFLAVLNSGGSPTASGSISIYTIGGAGTLYFQQSYPTSGTGPVALGIDFSGTYLYALDTLAPDNSGRGDVTVYQIDPIIGKLTLITNRNTVNTNGTQLPYFEVNFKPVQLITKSGGTGTTGGNYLYVLDQAYTIASGGAQNNPNVPAACLAGGTVGQACQTPDVFFYQITTGGQLTLTQNAPLTLPVPPGAASTIASGGSYVYIADTQNGVNGSTGFILPFTVGTSGVLQSLVGGPVGNAPGASTFPDAIVASSNTQFLYVANFGPGTTNQSASNISAFTIDTTNGRLQPISSTQGIYPSGSGPVWMSLDPTNQYLYTANFNDSTISAKVLQTTTGQLSNLNKGNSAQPTVGQPTYIAVTSRTY